MDESEMDQEFPWYTARGDDGSTGLLGEGRVPKHHPQPEAFGAVDEAGSMIGFARALAGNADVNEVLIQVQRHCYSLMAELAATKEAQPKFRQIGPDQVQWLSEQTDRFGSQVSMPREFILPGESPAEGALDMARTAVRRAERRVSRLVADGLVENMSLVAYLNRLSSLLFVLSRFISSEDGSPSIRLAKDEPKGE